jgi:predicted AlkP superfamily phosphohydrolase/phosphomutase
MKVLVIGLDGVTWDLLSPWIEAGELPNLQQLMQQGAWGNLRTTLPPISSSSWSSFLSGVNPGKHGLVDFVHPSPDSYKVSLVNAASRRTYALWNWLNDGGYRVGLLGIPTTYPTEPVDGFMVSGFLTPGQDSEWAYPASLKTELLAELGEFYLMPNERYRSTSHTGSFLNDLTTSVENRTQAALYLMRQKPWDLFAVVYWDTDMVQHETWSLLDPEHPQHNPAMAEEYRDKVLEFHRKVDADVGRLLAEVDSETLIIVMSDHGFGPVHSFFLVNNWLASIGLLHFKNRLQTKVKQIFFRLGFTPLKMFRLAKALGLGRLRKKVRFQQKAGLLNSIFLSFDDVDWSRTKAFSMGSFGQIYINLVDALPQGVVQPGQEYEELRELIIREAGKLRDPSTDKPLVENVYRREEIYSGPYLKQTPDVIIQTRNWEYMAFGHADFGSNKMVEPIVGLSGHHRPDGLVILAGPGVKPGFELESSSILDLAPTILHALDVAVPSDLDGRVLSKAFESSSPMVQQVKYSDKEIYKDSTASSGLSDDETEKVMERLRKLGYVG